MTNLLQKIQSGAIIKDAWISIPSSWTTELVAQAGFDTMTIDTQHGLATNLSQILPMLQTIEGTGTAPLVRLPNNDGAFAMSMLDAGVEGLICPMIKTAADTEAFVKNCLYQPRGERSFGPIRAAKVHKDYFKNADESILKLVMIETKESVENLEDIAKVDGLSGFYVGPWDLGLSIGLETQGDFNNPSLLSVFDKVLNEAAKSNKFTAIHCTNPEDGLKMSKMGFQMVTIFNDTTAIINAANETLKAFKK